MNHPGTCFQKEKIKFNSIINIKFKILKIMLQITFSFPVTALDLTRIQCKLLLMGTGINF